MSTKKPLSFDSSTGVTEEVGTTDDVVIGKVELTGVGGIAIDAGGKRVVDVATPTAPGDAATKAYVDGVAGGAVTSVTASAPIASSGGAAPNISLNTSGVVAGTYTNATVDIDTFGRVTSASSGTAPVTSVSAASPLASSGGTTPTISVTPGSATGDVLTWTGAAWLAQQPGSLSIASERWVTKGGSDVTGDGSISRPYASVTAAMASITTAIPTSRWVIRVGAGSYNEGAATLTLKPNVFIVGESRDSVRITAAAVAMDASFSIGSGLDNRSGIENVILTGACTFDWTTVTSAAGKLYFRDVAFVNSVTMTGWNNAIAQAQCSGCLFFGALSVQGINVGVFNDNILFSTLTLTQSPFGGVPTILAATGGNLSGALTATTTVNDFNRRISVFARSFLMGSVTIDGPSTYLDVTVDSVPSTGVTILNGATRVDLNQGGLNRDLSNLTFPTAANASITPNATGSHNLGDVDKQWLFAFSNVVASTNSYLLVSTLPGSYGPTSSGNAIYIAPDAYGLNANVNGGNVEIETGAASGTGDSGTIILKTGAVATGVRGDLDVDVRDANLALTGPITLNADPGAAGEVLTSNGPGAAPTWEPAAAGTVTTVTASAPLASSGGATPDISLTGVVDVANGGTGLSTVSAAGNILVAQTSSTLSSVPVSGDATLATSGALTVTGLQTNPVSASAPTAGQFLGWTGAAWAPADVTGGGGFGPGFVYYLEYGTAATSPPPSLATAKLMDFSYSTDPQSSTGNVTVPNSTTQQELATFLADTGVPGDATIPAGLWDLALYCHSSGAADETSFRFLVQVWDGATLTTLATSDDTYITGVANVTQQYTASVFIPLTDLTATDRLVIRIEGRRWVANTHSIHSFFQGTTISHAHTTLTAPGGTGLVKVVAGVIQTPASLLIDADVSNTAAIAQSKIANLTTDLAAKANTSLSNLTSPTSVNQDLLPSTVLRSVGSPTAAWSSVNTLGLSSPADLAVATGQNGSPATPNSVGYQLVLSTDAGGLTSGTNGGFIALQTQSIASGAGNSGAISLTTGSVASGTRGDVSVNARQLNLTLDSALTVNTAAGTSGQVLTSQGAGAAPVWSTVSASNPFGSKVYLVVEGGSYATLQAAVDVASANDVILVGPKATGDWGNVTLSVTNKPLTIAALSGAGSNKIVKVGSITYDLGVAGPALNVNLNEVYLYGLYIQGAFAGGSAVTLTGGANYPGRLRLFGCYVLNSSATGAAAVTNSNSGANSSIYLDNCVVSLTPSTTGSAIVQTAGYTVIRNRTEISGSAAVGATGNAINVSSGTIEIYDSFVELGRAVPTINITGATTFVSAGYSTIKNSSNAAGAACVYIGTSGATFGAGDATLAAGSTLPTSAVAVSGVAGGSFLYANVSFGYTTTVSTVTATATSQSGGLFAYGMSVGSALGTTFAVNASGNITKINNVTTSFPSVQGTAGQVLTNNGSGTLSWTTVSGGANTTLSNLVGPTSVNTSLIPSTSGLDLGTAASKWDDIFVSNVRNPSGDLVLATGPAAIPVAAPYDIFILTAGPNANVDSGDITIATAAATGTGNSGTLTIQTGTTVSGTRGNVAVNTRQLALTMTGALTVNASTGTSGQVLTSQGAGSPPIWAASSGSVTGVTASAPLASSGGATPDISLTYGASGAGGAAFGGYAAKTANYTAGATDYVINCTANSFTVTLPTAIGVTGRMYTVKNSASGTTITVNTTSAQTIDGAASVSISTQYASITVMSTGANWIIV